MYIKLSNPERTVKVYWRYSLTGDSYYNIFIKHLENNFWQKQHIKKVINILEQHAPKRTITCYVVDEEGNALGVGEAICQPEDNFVKDKGRVISLRKATKDFSTEDFVLISEAYVNRKPAKPLTTNEFLNKMFSPRI